VPDRGLTLAEMASGEKNQISARGQALRKLREFLQLR
jgi:inosine/xanthosine triphosphate pyrophosphatase family protein